MGKNCRWWVGGGSQILVPWACIQNALDSSDGAHPLCFLVQNVLHLFILAGKPHLKGGKWLSFIPKVIPLTWMLQGLRLVQILLLCYQHVTTEARATLASRTPRVSVFVLSYSSAAFTGVWGWVLFGCALSHNIVSCRHRGMTVLTCYSHCCTAFRYDRKGRWTNTPDYRKSVTKTKFQDSFQKRLIGSFLF